MAKKSRKKQLNLDIVKNGNDLQKLFEATTFAEYESPEFENMKIEQVDPSESYPLDLFVHVSECSSFCGTLIMLSHDYENSGYDCLFLQELVRAFAAGKLRYIDC